MDKQKTLSINNTGTKIQAVLAHRDEEEAINIDHINVVDISSSHGGPMGGPAETGISNDETFSADEILSDQQGQTETYTEDRESLLTRIFQNIQEKKLDLALNIPSRFVKSIFIDRDFSDIKTKKKEEAIKNEINSRLDRPISPDHYDYLDTAENKVISFTYEGNPPFLNMYDQVKDLLGIKTKIQLIIPDEVALANLIDYNYEPNPDEIYAIVHLGKEYSQLIIMKGGKFLHISHTINIPLNSPDILNKISGRLLYEKDLNDIDAFDQMIITGLGKSKNAVDFFRKKLSFNSPVEYLTLNENKFSNIAKVGDDTSKVAIALGIMVSSIQKQMYPEEAIDLIPEYIKDKQTLFKLSWYNLLILVLLFLSPIYIGLEFNRQKNNYQETQRELEKVNTQIENIKDIQKIREETLQKIRSTAEELDKVKNLSKNNYQLSKSIEKIKQVIREQGGSWINNLDYDKNKISLSGYSIFRNRPPNIVAEFPDAKLESIEEREIRGETVYLFKITINKVYKDTDIYNPKVE